MFFAGIWSSHSQGITKEDLELLKQTIETFTFDILGLVNVSKENFGTDKLSGAVEILINLRKEARLNKGLKSWYAKRILHKIRA